MRSAGVRGLGLMQDRCHLAGAGLGQRSGLPSPVHLPVDLPLGGDLDRVTPGLVVAVSAVRGSGSALAGGVPGAGAGAVTVVPSPMSHSSRFTFAVAVTVTDPADAEALTGPIVESDWSSHSHTGIPIRSPQIEAPRYPAGAASSSRAPGGPGPRGRSPPRRRRRRRHAIRR